MEDCQDPDCHHEGQDRYTLPATEFDEESAFASPPWLSLANHSLECRNVLVKNCAHVPRNYQYRDGIQLVSLLST